MRTIEVRSTTRTELIDITRQVREIADKVNVQSGICLVYTPHTTAAITINENADPDVRYDVVKGLESLNLESVPFHHSEGNSPAHVKSSLMGCSEMIIIENGTLQLGTWQGIFFCEFDGPRSRKVLVKIMA